MKKEHIQLLILLHLNVFKKLIMAKLTYKNLKIVITIPIAESTPFKKVEIHHNTHSIGEEAVHQLL